MIDPAAPPARARPLFARIFLTMVLSVLAVQVANFLFVMLTPPPLPQLTRLDAIADALATGHDAGHGLVVARAAALAGGEADGHSRRLNETLARLLRVPPEQVRLSISRPLPMAMMAAMGRPGFGDRRPPRTDAIEHDLVFGRFTAALRQPDGSWRTVSPRRVGLSQWQWRVLLTLIGTVLLVAPFAWLLSRRLAAPIAAFAAAAERLGRDPRAPPLVQQGPAEVQDATRAFNEMQARLRRYVEDRTAMIGAIAHDLRTPLMRLAFRIESVPEPLRLKAEADIDEMRQMLSAVLDFVRDMNQAHRRQRLDLRSLVESVADNMADVGDDVAVAPGAALVIEGDGVALRAVFANLLSNAVAYGGSARVAVIAQADKAIVEIADRGPGLPAEDLARVFEPFYRAERSRNRATGGVGLGLATVRTVVHAHGGDVTLENRLEGGMVARVTLPI